MKKMKKFLLTGLVTLCAGLFGIGAASVNPGVEAAAETPAYTTKDVFVMGKMTNVYVDGGNVNVHFTLSETDVANTAKVTASATTIKQKLQEIDFFDNIMMGTKTLTQLGFSGDFWDASNMVTYGIGEPQKVMYMSLHADPEVWAAAVGAGEIQFGIGGTQMTFKEGALLPSYGYLMGEENPVVYKASMEYVSSVVDHNIYTYGLTSYGKTDIDSLQYVQAYYDVEGCGYFGFSLEGDDYLGDGTQVAFSKHIPLEHFPNYFTQTILVNGVAGKVKAYSLFNLGDAGKGYISAQMFETEENIQTITIPKGTLFPSRALEDLSKINGGNGVWMYYQTQTDKTYYRTENGYVCLVDVQEDRVEALQAQRAEKVDADYFAEDVTAMNNAVSQAIASINAAADVAAVEAAYEEAAAALAAILTKEDSKTAAVEELNAYKGEEGYFRAEELAQKQAIIATATTAINGATEKQTIVSAVASAKTQIDALKSSAQYADEELKPLKDAAKAAIEGYKANEEYFATEADAKAEAVATGLDGVKAAKNEEEIAAAEASAKAAIDEIKTKAQYVAEAVEELNAYKGEEGYFLAAEVAQKQTIIATATANCEAAESAAEIALAVLTAKGEIDALKTAEEYAIENEIALAPFKASATTQINEKKATVDYALYTEANREQINLLYANAKAAIKAAVTQAEIDSAVAGFIAAIDAVEQVKTEIETGCGSTAIGGVLGMLALLGAGMLLKKKED